MEWRFAAKLACFITRAIRTPTRLIQFGPAPLNLSDAGNFSLEVVADAEGSRRLVALTGDGPAPHYFEAQLTVEGNGAQGEHHVVVSIHGTRVGKLSQPHASRFRHKIARSRSAQVLCPAMVMRGGRERRHLGVWLDVAL